MGEAFYSWMPPSAGVYTIYARSTDNQGNQGMAASSKITIMDKIAQVLPAEGEQPSLEQSSDEEEEEEIQVAEPVEPSANPVVAPNRAINCRSYPDTSSDIVDVLESSHLAVAVARLANNTWYLVTHPQSLMNCWVSASLVTTTGDFSNVPVQQPQIPQAQPPAQPPEEEPPAPPAPETDTNPPAIAYISISPTTIYQQGCGGFVQTAVLTVDVIDLGGVATVEAAWTDGSVKLTHIGGYTYQATIGPISTKGSVLIYGSAVDKAGNWTPFSTTITVDCCVC